MLLCSIIVFGFVQKTFTGSKLKKLIEEIKDQSDKSTQEVLETIQEGYDKIKEELEEIKKLRIEREEQSKAQTPEPAQKMVDTIDCDNPESFELFYANLNNLKMPIGQLVGLYISALYQFPEEKAFIAETIHCLQKSMERMASNEKATDRKRIAEEVAKHKALLQEKLKQEKMKEEQPK